MPRSSEAESEALSKRVAASKAEVVKLREEYERLLEEGANRSCERKPDADKENAATTSPKKKQRTYNVEEVREYMRRKQREKQLEHMQQQLRKTESDVDAKKRRLRELQQKSRNIVAKNTRLRSRSRSRDTPRDIEKPEPAVAREPTTGGSSTVRVPTPEIVHPVSVLPVVQDIEEDASRRNKAAVVIQANFKGYRARNSYRLKLETRRRQQLEAVPKKPTSEWLETDPQSYPYNFISVVKRKLNLAVRTPSKSVDAAVQITPPTSSQLSVKELKEKIEASIKKSESKKIDEAVRSLRELETSKPKSLRSFLEDLDLKKVESMRLRSKASDSDTSKNVPDLTSESVEYSESFESGDDAIFKRPDVALSRVGVKRGPRRESSAASQSGKSSKKPLLSESVDVHSDIDRERSSRGSKEKSSSSLSKKSDRKTEIVVASESDGVKSDISRERSSRSSKERSGKSQGEKSSEAFERPASSESDAVHQKTTSRSSVATAASLQQEKPSKSIASSESDDFRLEIDTDKVRNLRLVRRKDRRDSHDNTLDYYRDGVASSVDSSFRTLPGRSSAPVSEEELPFSSSGLESRRESIIVAKKCAYSKSCENSLENIARSPRPDEDLASFQRYMRDFDESKKIRHSSSEGGANSTKSSSSRGKYSSNFSSEALAAPAVSLQRNADSDKENAEEEKQNVREVVLKAGEKKSVETTGNSNQIHVKFEAELRLLNDFNDSLRQYMDVEKSLLKLQNKSTAFETRDTQTSLVTKSATSLLVSKQDSVPSDSVKSLTGRSINTSRGDDFESPKLVRTITEDDAPELRTDDASALIPSVNYSRGSDVGSYVSMDPSSVMRLSDIPEASCNETLEETTAQVSHVSKEKPKNIYAGLSLGMFEQLIKDEDARIENLKIILKIREQALLDRTKGKLAWLEIQKKNLLETGKLHEASLVKKKQRSIIIKLQHEKHEMQKLNQLQKAASKERKTILKEQRNMIKAQLSSTDGAVTKIRRTRERRTSSGPVNVYSYRRETVVSETSYSRRSSVADDVARSSKSECRTTEDEKAVVAEAVASRTEAARRSLLMREAALQKRREAVEELLRWHRRLRDEERRIADLEIAASNLIARDPVASLNGAQLNVLRENMTGRSDGRFADDRTYELSRTTLERLCVDGKSPLVEIAQNISSITDEISALYRLSSASPISAEPEPSVVQSKSSSLRDSSKTSDFPSAKSASANEVGAPVSAEQDLKSAPETHVLSSKLGMIRSVSLKSDGRSSKIRGVSLKSNVSEDEASSRISIKQDLQTSPEASVVPSKSDVKSASVNEVSSLVSVEQNLQIVPKTHVLSSKLEMIQGVSVKSDGRSGSEVSSIKQDVQTSPEASAVPSKSESFSENEVSFPVSVKQDLQISCEAPVLSSKLRKIRGVTLKTDERSPNASGDEVSSRISINSSPEAPVLPTKSNISKTPDVSSLKSDEMTDSSPVVSSKLSSPQGTTIPDVSLKSDRTSGVVTADEVSCPIKQDLQASVVSSKSSSLRGLVSLKRASADQVSSPISLEQELVSSDFIMKSSNDSGDAVSSQVSVKQDSQTSPEASVASTKSKKSDGKSANDSADLQTSPEAPVTSKNSRKTPDVSLKSDGMSGNASAGEVSSQISIKQDTRSSAEAPVTLTNLSKSSDVSLKSDGSLGDAVSSQVSMKQDSQSSPEGPVTSTKSRNISLKSDGIQYSASADVVRSPEQTSPESTVVSSKLSGLQGSKSNGMSDKQEEQSQTPSSAQELEFPYTSTHGMLDKHSEASSVTSTPSATEELKFPCTSSASSKGTSVTSFNSVASSYKQDTPVAEEPEIVESSAIERTSVVSGVHSDASRKIASQISDAVEARVKLSLDNSTKSDATLQKSIVEADFSADSSIRSEGPEVAYGSIGVSEKSADLKLSASLESSKQDTTSIGAIVQESKSQVNSSVESDQLSKVQDQESSIKSGQSSDVQDQESSNDQGSDIQDLETPVTSVKSSVQNSIKSGQSSDVQDQESPNDQGLDIQDLETSVTSVKLSVQNVVVQENESPDISASSLHQIASLQTSICSDEKASLGSSFEAKTHNCSAIQETVQQMTSPNNSLQNDENLSGKSWSSKKTTPGASVDLSFKPTVTTHQHLAVQNQESLGASGQQMISPDASLQASIKSDENSSRISGKSISSNKTTPGASVDSSFKHNVTTHQHLAVVGQESLGVLVQQKISPDASLQASIGSDENLSGNSLPPKRTTPGASSKPKVTNHRHSAEEREESFKALVQQTISPDASRQASSKSDSSRISNRTTLDASADLSFDLDLTQTPRVSADASVKSSDKNSHLVPQEAASPSASVEILQGSMGSGPSAEIPKASGATVQGGLSPGASTEILQVEIPQATGATFDILQETASVTKAIESTILQGTESQDCSASKSKSASKKLSQEVQETQSIEKDVRVSNYNVEILDKEAKNSRNTSVKLLSETEPSEENTSSEITDLLSDPPVPVIGVTVEEKRDVRTRVSQILADANIGGNLGGSQRVQDLYVTTYDLISPDNSPELRSPTDENDRTTKDIFGNEAEELLKKQLAIEQEIKALEQQQKEQLPYLYMREIPNKPPPPYTPPTPAPSILPPTVLPLTVEQVASVVPDVAHLLYDAQTRNALSAVALPEKLNIPDVDRPCLEFLFDLCKETAVEHYAQFEETSAPPWLKPQRNVGLKRPLGRVELERHLERKLRRLFGFEKVDVKESMIIKWSRKRRDHVDELLVVESQAEEAEWTNYDQDELVVKKEATAELLNALLDETVGVFKRILAKKRSRDAC